MEDVVYARVLNYLTIRPRSEKEMRDYIKKILPHTSQGSDVTFAQDDREIIDAIITKLKAQKFLNDEEFSRMWIRNRTEFKPKGWRFIKLELQQKGISQDLLRKLELEMKGEGEEKRDEKELAVDFLERKKKKYEGMGKQERFTKAGSMLARRGFDLDTIKKAIDSVFGK